MAIIFIDGFDRYTTIGDLETYGPWAEVAGAVESGTRNSYGKQISLSASSHNFLYNNAVDFIGKTIYAGAAWNFTGNAGTTIYLYLFSQNFPTGSTTRISFSIEDNSTDATRKLQIRVNNVVQATSTNTLNLNTWYYIEVKAFHHVSGGIAEIMVDGVSWVSASSLATTDDVEHLEIGLSIPGDAVKVDDFYLLDDTGTDNNTWRGDSRVLLLQPNGDSSVDYTRSGGATNYENVDEDLADDETTYVSSNTVTDKDLYTLENLPIGLSTFLTVQLTTVAKKDNVGNRAITPTISVLSTEQTGEEEFLGAELKYLRDNFSTKDGSLVWDETAINAMLIGHEVTD